MRMECNSNCFVASGDRSIFVTRNRENFTEMDRSSKHVEEMILLVRGSSTVLEDGTVTPSRTILFVFLSMPLASDILSKPVYLHDRRRIHRRIVDEVDLVVLATRNTDNLPRGQLFDLYRLAHRDPASLSHIRGHSLSTKELASLPKNGTSKCSRVSTSLYACRVKKPIKTRSIANNIQERTLDQDKIKWMMKMAAKSMLDCHAWNRT